MSRSDLWMPLYIGDYLADTGHLTTVQHGAYLLLIMHYWRKRELPADDKQLAAIAKLPLRIWLECKETIQAFFHDGWKHKKIEAELAKRIQVSEKRAASGAMGGKSKSQATAKQKSSKSEANASFCSSMTQSQSQKDSEADASGAEAPIDHRKRLFDEGLPKLAALTGKGPDACRSFVGKCLKSAGDDAVTVLGLIEEAERNRVVDPSAWIAARLKGSQNDRPSGSKIIQAADDLCRKIAGFDGPPSGDRQLRGGTGAAVAGLLPHG